MGIAYPAVMYDIINKKIVAIFRSTHIASKYIFGKPAKITNRHISTKRVWEDGYNPYKTRITFRAAKKEQSDLLGINEFLILDKDFILSSNLLERTLRDKGTNGIVITNRIKLTTVDRNKQFDILLNKGYTPVEVGSYSGIHHATVKTYVQKTNRVYVMEVLSRYNIDELRQLHDLIEQRIINKFIDQINT